MRITCVLPGARGKGITMSGREPTCCMAITRNIKIGAGKDETQTYRNGDGRKGIAEGGLNRKASGHRVAAERSSALRKTGTARKGATRKTASRGKSAASRKTR